MTAHITTHISCDGCGATSPPIVSDTQRTTLARRALDGWTVTRPARRFDPTLDHCPKCRP